MPGTEIERTEHAAEIAEASIGLASVDSWVAVMRDVCQLAGYVADTDFVPKSLRGNAAAIAAAILTGREMGMPPMMSLQHLHVIHGKPGQSAEAMRAKVLSAGHEIRDVETTDTRCVVEGRRRGESQWTRVTFTADQAKRARIDLGGYPEDKLYARATSRLCRRKFPDAIAGLPTVDELEDHREGEGDDAGVAAVAGSAEDRRAVRRDRRSVQRRRTPSRAAGEGETARPSSEDTSEAVSVDTAATNDPQDEAPVGPPLPGEVDDEPADAEASDTVDEPTAPSEPDGVPMVTRPQLSKLHAALSTFGIGTTGNQTDDRAEKLATVGALVGRPLNSSSDMTRQEAGAVLDTLDRLTASDDPERALDLLLGETAHADSETPANGETGEQLAAQQTLYGSE